MDYLYIYQNVSLLLVGQKYNNKEHTKTGRTKKLKEKV